MQINRKIKIAVATLWALAIPALSLLPPRFFHRLLDSATPTIPGTDKIVHAIMYAVLTALLLWALRPPDKRISLRLIWNVVVLAILYGILMEMLQDLFHDNVSRTGDPWDGLANAVGAAVVAFAWWLLKPRQPQPQKADQ